MPLVSCPKTLIQNMLKSESRLKISHVYNGSFINIRTWQDHKHLKGVFRRFFKVGRNFRGVMKWVIERRKDGRKKGRDGTVELWSDHLEDQRDLPCFSAPGDYTQEEASPRQTIGSRSCICRRLPAAGQGIHYLLTPWCRVVPEQLTALQLVKKFPAFHRTRRFITALTSVRHMSLSWASPIQSI